MNFFKKLFGSSDSETKQDNPFLDNMDTAENETNTQTAETVNEEQANKERDKEFETLRDDGLRAMRMNEYQYAERLFIGALTRKDDEDTRSYLAEVYLRLGAGAKALPLLESLSEKHPDNEDLHITVAQAAEQAGDWDKMRKAANLAYELNDNNPNALFLIAKADYQQKEYLQTVTVLTQLLSKRFDAAPIYQLRAQTLFDMQQYDSAEKDVDELLSRDEVSEETYQLKGDIRYALEDYDGAVEFYKKMRENDPFNKASVLRENVIYLKQNNLERAINLLDEAIELQPDFSEAYFQRGNIRRQLHDNAGATDDLKRSLELNKKIAAQFNGEYSNIENQMNAQARLRNPFGF